jgi:hypothetical protein
MKKLLIVSFAVISLIVGSCHGSGSTGASKSDTTITTGGPDSAANNGIIPPSAAPGNANNSSLADTTYKAKEKPKAESPKPKT